ncbi:protein PHYTOCHROME-DEPENDENT LATE-FLOWERING-like isoform X1 [Actinidia eriantha]|uniref:protein PHYTOCHROME-DEPENDENT LATE-FLOWERING-like isoform X1 n=1 Tax=Actinidia eriantha TaxID=165200 RepID=UPI00258D7AE8|nr:protein PHYTOCHROME-DEPENDENT LATE-FLOWERING-like isoform X1 [Actinidia eriantha]
MGVSFKVAKAGTRYRPKLLQVEDIEIENGPIIESQRRDNKGDCVGPGDKVTDYSNALVKPILCVASEDLEVSFSLNLFPDGFSIGKSNQFFNDVPKKLHPYDRASETLFCAIENGCLPGDILDDLPCKYVNGALLCEIRDYRNILPQNGDIASSMENSPVIHKVVLQMCMESVVKDISSISNDSWTYNDMLEFESRILKALQPDLRLDPKPIVDRFCEKPPAEKLNLGISWNRKKRKLNDASITERVFSNPSSTIQMSDASRNSNLWGDVEFQDRVSNTHLIPSSIITSKRNNNYSENMLQSSVLISQANWQLEVTNNQSLYGALTPSNAHSAPKTNYGHCDPRIPKSLTPGESRRYGTLANRRPIGKKHKQEPQNFSQEQLPDSHVETKFATELEGKSKLLYPGVGAERFLHERTHENMHPSPSSRIGQQAIQGMPKLQQVPNFRVKEEPIETSSCQSVNPWNARDNRHILDMRIGHSNLLQSQLLQSSGLVKDNIPANAVQWNHIGQSIGNNRTNEVTQCQMGKALRHSQVPAGATNASIPSRLSNFLPRKGSLPTKRESNSHRKGSSANRVQSLAGISATSTSSAVCLPVGNPSPSPSVMDDAVIETYMPSGNSDDVLDRFPKLKMVTPRYALNDKERKCDQIFERKFFSCTNPQLAFHLLNSEDNSLKDGKTDTTSHSDCSQENKHNMYKTRKFTFVRSSHVSQANDIAHTEAQNKLTILEKLDEGIVEATAAYCHEEFDPIELHLLETFANTQHACLFAAQFSSLMMREGYRLAGYQTEPAPLVIDGQPQTSCSTATPAAQMAKLVSPTPVPGQCSYMLNPISSSMSAFNPRQSPSQNNFSGSHLLPSANLQSSLPLSAGYFSKSPLENASQLGPIHPQWQHIINKHAFRRLHMLQRERLQQQLLQKGMMMGGFSAATPSLGTMHLGGGVQGFSNIGPGSVGNVVPMGGSMSSLRMAENGGRASMSGISIDGSGGMGPTCPPTFSGVAYQAINRQPPAIQMQHQLYMQQLQEMSSPVHIPAASSWTEHVSLPLSSSSLIQMEQQSQIMGSQQISSALVPHQMDSGNIKMDHENPGLSSLTPGSMSSGNTNSSMELHGLTEGGSATQTGGFK